MRLAITCLLLALALPAAAQIYKYTDAKGNTVYTNQPPEGQATETVVLPPTNTVEMQKPATPLGGPAIETEEQIRYRVLELTDIPDEGALRANNGSFSVGVNLEPSLQPGHRLRLLLDGRPYGQASSLPRLQLSNVERGEHSLAVEVLRGEQSIQQSATVTFAVQRVNTSSPALRPPPSPAP
ncbi:MAG: DUF4124 domain-containing protein [Pseudomonas sp.]